MYSSSSTPSSSPSPSPSLSPTSPTTRPTSTNLSPKKSNRALTRKSATSPNKPLPTSKNGTNGSITKTKDKQDATVDTITTITASTKIAIVDAEINNSVKTDPMQQYLDLPTLISTSVASRTALFVKKLNLCSIIFDFSPASSSYTHTNTSLDTDAIDANDDYKDIKRLALLEIVDYVNTGDGEKIFSASVDGDNGGNDQDQVTVIQTLLKMVKANIIRTLPPTKRNHDPEEDEPTLANAWPHLQIVYEIFLRFIVSNSVNPKTAKKHVTSELCSNLIQLFASSDPRERDYLKTIVHRIYGKFMSHRSFIRKCISNVFYEFCYEGDSGGVGGGGVGELLEILGSIINGFAVPLKKEHLSFLTNSLIPLHRPPSLSLYSSQLSYCIIQYLLKDPETIVPILTGLFKAWPWRSAGKQVTFLNELEEILEIVGRDEIDGVSHLLFRNLCKCLDSEHFQVVERTLFLWHNEELVNTGCLSRLNATLVLPLIFAPLYKKSTSHWNTTVEGLAQNVLKTYMEYDLALYDQCSTAFFKQEGEALRKRAENELSWADVEQMAVEEERGGS